MEAFFILDDIIDINNVNGRVVSSPHSILDISSRGFWTGDGKDFPYNADFTPWEEFGDTAFFDKELAEKRLKELAEND